MRNVVHKGKQTKKYKDDQKERKKAAWRKWAGKNRKRLKLYWKRFYRKNKAKCQKYYERRKRRPDFRKRGREAQRRRREKLFQVKVKLIELLGGKCKCGFKDPRALEFDHINPKTKSFNICLNLHQPFSLLVREAKKCQVLCANCHRLKTCEENDWTGKH